MLCFCRAHHRFGPPPRLLESSLLQAAEDRNRRLQAEVERCEDHALRAEEWLLRVYKEIEDKFFPRQDTASPQNNARG